MTFPIGDGGGVLSVVRGGRGDGDEGSVTVVSTVTYDCVDGGGGGGGDRCSFFVIRLVAFVLTSR